MLKAVKRSRSLRLGGGGPGIVAVGQQQYAGGRGEDDGGAHGPAYPLETEPGLVSAPLAMRLRDGHGHGRRGPLTQNADIPPVSFPEGRNPYLNRPLPPPPPPKTPAALSAAAAIPPPTMPARPSTSSGPGSSRNANVTPNFEKRLSKDDLSLLGRMGMGSRKKGLQPYRIGIRGGTALPTPEPSPDSLRSPLPLSSMPTRMPTPVSFSSGEIQIGMALGSPSRSSSFQAGWQPQAQENYSPPPPQRTPEPPIQRQKTQKRRIFGSLFGSRKRTEPAKIAEPTEANRSVVSVVTASTATPTWSANSSPFRSNTVASKTAGKYKPLIVRSRTEPRMEDAVPEPKPAQEPIRQPEPKTTNIWLSPPESSPAPTSSSPSGPGLLDIEIPDIRLERYSIMFSGVLNPQAGGRPKSSLLERRQATLEKLKTINDRIMDEEQENERPIQVQRRGTSPQPTKSPAFTLFPSTSLGLPRPSPRTRSNTSPAHLPSPSRASFEPPEEQQQQQPVRKERKTVTIVSPRSMDERYRAAQVEKLREEQIQAARTQRRQQEQQLPPPKQATSFHFGPEESGLILDSPQSMSSDGEYRDDDNENAVGVAKSVIPPLKPVAAEPQWQMISPPPSTSSEAGSTKRTMSSASSSASSTQTHLTRPSLEVEEGDAALKAAVEISIARQISISRQQRQLLRPLQTIVSQAATTAGSRGAPGVMRSASASTMRTSPVVLSKGMMGRVIETKQSVPTLVVPSEQYQQHSYRKSERIVLEAA
ncbi:hypothetical protein B0H63DRAFT_519625 [Podospora didyma]|uniref:Uncharacterized protein n=1 Tax=Podospora didyma TaxID=330526 RepID=A0AAE0U4K2_9PEZI|nr:hypothetical protein B0H63DRAFT_519625 [Podospora didyma]